MQILQGVKKVPVVEAILHCAAVPSGWAFRLSELEMAQKIYEWHTAAPPVGRGWKNTGYHYIVFPSGNWWSARPLDQPGSGVIGRNYGFLQILMIERAKIDRIGKFHDFFNERQKDTVRHLCYAHQIKVVSGHNDWAQRLCPGFKVRSQDFVGYPPLHRAGSLVK